MKFFRFVSNYAIKAKPNKLCALIPHYDCRISHLSTPYGPAVKLLLVGSTALQVLAWVVIMNPRLH